jgi:hypothetical protein
MVLAQIAVSRSGRVNWHGRSGLESTCCDTARSHQSGHSESITTWYIADQGRAIHECGDDDARKRRAGAASAPAATPTDVAAMRLIPWSDRHLRHGFALISPSWMLRASEMPEIQAINSLSEHTHDAT